MFMTNEWGNYHKQMGNYGLNGWGILWFMPRFQFPFHFHFLLFHMPSSTGGACHWYTPWSYWGEKRHMGGLTYSPSFHCRFQNFKTMTNPPGIVSPILDLHWELGIRPVYMKWKYCLRFEYALR